MSSTKKLATAFEQGAVFTAKEIKTMYGLSNPYEAIRQLRMQGMCIYKNKNGYRLGIPSKSMVSALSKIFGNRIFG